MGRLSRMFFWSADLSTGTLRFVRLIRRPLCECSNHSGSGIPPSCAPS